MECGTTYCVFNKNLACVLAGISVNTQGMCEDCVLITLPEDLLEKLKDQQRGEIEQRWRLLYEDH